MINIGVVINQIESPFFSTQKSALMDWSEDKDVKLIFFTGEAINSPDEYLRINNFTYGFINCKKLDGLIIYSGSLGNFVDSDDLEKFISRWKDIPIVSINHPIKEYPSTVSNAKQAIYDLVEHIVHQHNYKEIAIVSGPENSFDSSERLNFFLSALEANNLEISEDFIYYGDFTPESGKQAARYFLDRGLPEVILCLNDDMALNVIEVLKKHNISVPKDVAVTGFDGLDFTSNVFPSLTTIELPLSDISCKSAELLLDKIEGREVKSLTEVECKFISRQSCGCMVPKLESGKINTKQEELSENVLLKQMMIIKECLDGKSSSSNLHTEFYKLLTNIEPDMDSQSLDKITSNLYEIYMINNIATAQIEYNKNYKFFLFHWVFSLISSRISSKLYLAEILQEIADAIPLLHFSFLKLYLYGRPLDNSNGIVEPKDEVYLHLDYRDGKDLVISEKGIKTSIDEIYEADETTIIKTLSFSNDVFGLIQLGVDVTTDILFENIREVISNALHLCKLNMNMQRTQRQLEASLAETRVLNNRLKYLSIRDEMTGLLNRRGFFEMAEDYLNFRDVGSTYYILYIDMDGLKKINDKYGHNEGDWAIINFAKALDQSFRVTDIVARLGGDEFTAVIATDDHLTPNILESRLKNELEVINNRHKKPYDISASLGYIAFRKGEECDINKLLEAADRALYEKKREKYSPS